MSAEETATSGKVTDGGIGQKGCINYEEALSLAGEFGRFQKISFVLMSLVITYYAFQALLHVFVAAVPAHWCRLDESYTILKQSPLSHQVELNKSGDGEDWDNSCWMRDGASGNSSGEWMDEEWGGRYNGSHSVQGMIGDGGVLVPCKNGWVYDKSIYSSTIVSEWDLVCDRLWMGPAAFTLPHIVAAFGSLFYGAISDRFGRKKAIMISFSVSVLASTAMSFSPSYVAYCCVFAVNKFNVAPTYSMVMTYTMESVSTAHRGNIAAMQGYFFSLAFLLLAGMAYLIRDWTYLQLSLSAPFSLLAIGILVFLPESPRWLYSQSRCKEGYAALNKVARINGRTLPDNINVTVTNSRNRQASVIEICRSKMLLLYTFIIVTGRFFSSVINLGITYSSASFEGINPFLSFFLNGLLDIPSVIFTQIGVTKLGRRPTLIAAATLSTALLFSILAVPTHMTWVTVVLSVLARTAIVVCFITLSIYSVEIYPTNIRGVGASLSQTAVDIGHCIGPSVVLLSGYVRNGQYILFACMALVLTLTSFGLPETKTRPLFESVQEMNEASKRSTNGRPFRNVYLSTITITISDNDTNNYTVT